MQVFEFHFNPKARRHPPSTLLAKGEAPDQIFDSFCYEPENIYEKRLGSLFVVGELRNVLPQNLRFLDNLASFLKGKYYSAPIKFSPEASLKESLKKLNEFLEGIAKGGDVSWLGNLNLVVLSLKNFDLNLTKVGTPKILLLRAGQIIDVGKNLEFSEIEPYPLKIFGNIVSGKLAENDIILVLTKEVFEFFQNQNLLSEIAKITPFDEKKLREVLKNKERELSKISGICLLGILSKEILPKRKTIVSQPKIKEFSLSQLFRPMARISKKLIQEPAKFFASFGKKVQKKVLKVSPKKARPAPTPIKGYALGKFLKVFHPGWRPVKFLRWPKIKMFSSALDFFAKGEQIKAVIKNKNIILVICLIFFLLVGFVIFQKEKEREFKEYQSILNNIQQKVSEAENFLIFKNEKKAQILFKESWEEISPLTKMDYTLSAALRDQIFSLQKSIQENLGELNKLKIIEEPELLFEFNPREFIPQKLISFGQNLYFFSPYSQNLFKLNLAGQGILVKKDQKFSLAASVEDSILFFSKPNLEREAYQGSAEGRFLIFPFRNNQFEDPRILQAPYPNPNFKEFSSFKSNLYFLDSKKGEIIKYPYLGRHPPSALLPSADTFEWDSPQIWLNPATKKAIAAISMAVDGSIWILTPHQKKGGGLIDRYYAGNFRETLKFDFFPYPKDFSKIFASATLPYLYLLEPAQNRIVILTKYGKIVKQFQSQKFDNLKDFTLSEDGKTIWLLNGLKVYQISTQY